MDFPAQVKTEDPRVRMDRLKEASQAAGDTEAQRAQRYRIAREQAEVEEAARKDMECWLCFRDVVPKTARKAIERWKLFNLR